MKLKLNESLRVALEVFKRIDVPAVVADQIGMRTYNNGREQGIRLTRITLKLDKQRDVCFAENRTSDDIVVYISKPGEVSGVFGDFPTERAYQERKFFPCGKYAQAARFISQFLKSNAAI